MISIPKETDASLTRKSDGIVLTSIEDIQEYLTLEARRFSRGILTYSDARAVANIAMAALALEKAKRERDSEPQGEEISFDLIPSRSRGLVSGSAQ